jgi:hypothetical protein
MSRPNVGPTRRGKRRRVAMAGLAVGALFFGGLANGCGQETSLKITVEQSASENGAPTTVAPAPKSGVEIRKTDAGWELHRNGEPYFIRGVGGEGSMELLAKSGGNSIRTWGADDLKRTLDEAHRHGLTVAAGIWLGHRRHGFNYDDPRQVAQQREKAREIVLRYKDHPALLLWGLGNEMEGYGQGDDDAVWKAVDDLARMVKELDGNHPTMTVIGEIGGRRVERIHRLCPAIDVVGVNSYAGATSLPKRYRDAGGTKPYILTEFGPPGPWEVGKTSWGAVLEPSSSEKAAAYGRSYRKAVVEAKGSCLGSYAFLWGHKQEATATWFGMLLPDGDRLGAVDVLSTHWRGNAPSNRCPVIETMTVKGPSQVGPGAVVSSAVTARDPDGDALRVRWLLQADPLTLSLGGDTQRAPSVFPDALIRTDADGADVRLPRVDGAYRLFAFVYDDHGGAAVANVPLYVKGSHDQKGKGKDADVSTKPTR